MGIVFRTARKIYRCWRCGKTILKGEEYARDKSSEGTYCVSCGHVVIGERIRAAKSARAIVLWVFGWIIAWFAVCMLGVPLHNLGFAVILSLVSAVFIGGILNMIFSE